MARLQSVFGVIGMFYGKIQRQIIKAMQRFLLAKVTSGLSMSGGMGHAQGAMVGSPGASGLDVLCHHLFRANAVGVP